MSVEIADVVHEEVILSRVRRNSDGEPVEVFAEINGVLVIGGKNYHVHEHRWLKLEPK